MASLSAQLARLSRGEPARHGSKPSLLYDTAQAADTDIAATYALGLSGFAELCRADVRFEAFAKSLFAKAGAEFNRELQDADANARLDAALEAYLRLLSAYFLLPAATRTLEYLIRRFKMHVYNVDAALTCALPYHATAQFVRLVQVLQLEGTRWAFLSAVKTQGAPPTRDALVGCMARDSSLLALVCDTATAAATGSARGARGVATAFFTLLLAETVACMARVPEELLPRLLPYINAGLEKGASLEHHAGVLIVTAQLASRVQLAPPAVEALLVGIAKAARAPLEAHTLQAALQLTRTQAVTALPHHAVTFLVKMPALPELLGQLARNCAGGTLLRPLLSALAERLGAHTTYHDMLMAIVLGVPLQPCAELLASRLFAAAGHAACSPAAQTEAGLSAASAEATAILRALHRRCPAEVELAASRLLRKLKVHGAAASFSAFLRDALAGTTAQPLLGHESVTLGEGLSHEAPRVREAALRELALLAARTTAAAEGADVLQPGRLREVLLRRVCDADAQVAAAALSLPGLADMVSDDAALFGAAATGLGIVVAALRDGKTQGGKSGGNLRAVAKRALTLTAVTLTHRTPSLRDAAARLLMEYVVGSKALHGVSHLARGVAAGLHPVFGALAGAAGGAESAAADPQAQQQVIAAMGDAFCAASDDALVCWAHASWPGLTAAGRHTLLLALNRALATVSDAAAAARLAGAAWELLRQEPASVRAEGVFADAGCQWPGGLPAPEYLDTWALHEPSFTAVLRRALLLSVVQHLPAAAADERSASLGLLGQVFALLCDGASVPALDAHVDAVLARASAVFSSPSRFLILLVSASPADAPEAAQVKAAVLLRSDASLSVLAPALVALASPRRAVRRAAVETLSLLSSSAGTGAQAARGAKKAVKRTARDDGTEALAYVGAWVSTHAQVLVAAADNLTLAQLLRQALRDAAALPLREALFEFLGGSTQPYASLQLILALCDAGSEQATAAALTPMWDALVAQAGHTTDELQVAEAICRVFAAAIADTSGDSAGARAAVVRSLGESVAAQLRAVALRSISSALYSALPAADQDAVLAHCVLTTSRGEQQACRDAARGVICRLPLDGDAFARLLLSACSAMRGRLGASSSVKKRQARSQEPLCLRDAEPLDVVTAALEVLSWRQVEDGAPLLAPVSETVSLLLNVVRASREEQDAAVGLTAADTADGEDLSGRPALEYRIQLALNVLTALVRGAAPGCAVQVPVTVRALREVADAGVHKAALELLTAAASVAPERVVGDVLDITRALTSKATSGADDRASARALQEAFSAIAACWVMARSDGGEELLQHVVAALPAVPEHQRLPLMAALLRSMPAPLALTLSLDLLLSGTVASAEPAAADSLHTLAVTLCAVRPPLECFQALCGLLQRAAASDSGYTAAAAQFATKQLRAPGHAAWVAGQAGNAQLRASLAELVALAVGLLNRVSDKQAPAGDGQRARQSVQALLVALESLMAPLPFLQAVTQLFSSQDQQLQRRALRIFMSRMCASHAATAAASAEYAALIAPLIALVRLTDKALITTRCAALTVLAALIERFGQSEAFAAALLPVMPHLVAAAEHAKPLVAARGLDCIAAAVTALSTRIVPLLPATMPVILAVLEAEDGDASRVCAALAAVTAVIMRIDAFLSPFAHRLVLLLLAPRLLSSVSAEVVQAAAAARVALAQRLPARILIEPLTAAWEAALAAGQASAVALLQQLTVLVDAMDTSAAAAHHEAVFAFLLRCLDVRRVNAADEDEATEATESASVTAVVALVLKLSEARFTPLFMTALEWSRARTEGGARPLAFFRVVAALAAALRSVFVPFFRHLLTDAVMFLEQRTADDARPTKKSRGAAKAGCAPRLACRLRTEIMRALASCFLHDSVGFLDEARFNKLMGPLVAQLELEVPKEVSEGEAADADGVLVDCIVHMAQSVRQDTLWRPLNRGVLLATRSEQTRPRRLGLAIVTKLVDNLAEEYLVLLPETLPFLAELMEDSDEQVEAAARQLVANLSLLAEEDVADLLKA